MESAEHLIQSILLRNHGIQVLLWEYKTELVRALLLLKSVLTDFPDSPIYLPSEQAQLQQLSIHLYEDPALKTRRFLLIPQASTDTVGTWLNGWRRRLSEAPGTVMVIRRADYGPLCRRAPDLMSFVNSEVHEAGGLLPLTNLKTLNMLTNRLPEAWYPSLQLLPGEMPEQNEITEWAKELVQFAS
jgi:hypothetical protein